MHRILWNFQLSPQFCSLAAIPVDFQLGSLQHSTPPSPREVKISQSIAQFCLRGHRQEMDPSVPSATPWNRSWWSWNQDATKRWRSRALTKETAPAGHKGWNAGLWTARGGTGHQCHWLSKSKNRTILRQVPKQGAINFLGTISSYASRLLLYPLYCQ